MENVVGNRLHIPGLGADHLEHGFPRRSADLYELALEVYVDLPARDDLGEDRGELLHTKDHRAGVPENHVRRDAVERKMIGRQVHDLLAARRRT
ncbi:MAG: hypothetical protein LH467_15300 [Gemmatimonadaceae bacterium]|nr:hypothetical protein [Gemmatimonadaceae bacterium]